MHALQQYRRPRGLLAVRANLRSRPEFVRADGSVDVVALHGELDNAVRTFKAKHTADVDELRAAVNAMNGQITALGVGGAGDSSDPFAHPASHRQAMANLGKFARSGRPEDLVAGFSVNNALRTDSDPDGGYVVPEQIDSQISSVQRNISAMRRIARVQPVGSAAFKLPINTSAYATGWVGERESRPETSTGQISLLEFPSGEIYANPAATQRMLDDGAYDIASFLTEQIGTSFSEQEGAAFITGDGINKPRGILSYDPIADASWTWGKLGYIASGVAAAISDASNNGVDKLIEMVYGLAAGYRANANWLMNSKTAGVLRKLKDLEGRYLWSESVIKGQPSTLLGYPVEIDEDMSDIGANAYPVAFGDFRRGYIITDRTGINLLRDPYTNKPYVMFYATKRVGGGVSDFKAIKLLKIATS